jgi:Holliday junction resolvase RusA-like endonuclease
MSEYRIAFFVYGVPAPGGSKKTFVPMRNGVPVRRPGGSIMVNTIDDAGQRNKNWRAAVAQAAGEAMRGREPLFSALSVRIVFNMPRPKDHFKTNGTLKGSAPVHHIKKPDVLKLGRSTEDAMTGIVWRDDSIIVNERLHKVYAIGPAGASIEITELSSAARAAAAEAPSLQLKG